MALETVGGHFLHPQRELHGRRSCSVEVVQFEMPLPGYDRLSVQGRIQQMLSKGNVDIWVRVDYSSVSSQPPLNDVQALFRFNSFLQGLTADPAFGRARGFIIGNEPNLTATPAWWVARCVYGFNSEPGDTNNAHQFITTVNPVCSFSHRRLHPGHLLPTEILASLQAILPTLCHRMAERG